MIRHISAKKGFEWLLDWRLKAFGTGKRWMSRAGRMCSTSPLTISGISHYSFWREGQRSAKSLDEVDPGCQKPTTSSVQLHERERLAAGVIDAVFDSVSVVLRIRRMAKHGVIFCSSRRCVIIRSCIKKYLGTVVPYTDNFFATLNSAVFSDGSFVYIPKGVRCPLELSTYWITPLRQGSLSAR